jgi:hypothetical protein
MTVSGGMCIHHDRVWVGIVQPSVAVDYWCALHSLLSTLGLVKA